MPVSKKALKTRIEAYFRLFPQFVNKLEFLIFAPHFFENNIIV